MALEWIRNAVKSNPAAYRTLYPIVAGARVLARKIRHRMDDRTQRRTLARFRRFCSRLPDRVAAPFFVKVGANDGLTGDPCSDMLLADRRWKGLLVEPVPYCMDRLKSNFNDPMRFRIEQVAVDSSPGLKTFYYVSPKAAEAFPGLPKYYDQLGSFDRNHILKHIASLEPFIVECEIEVTTLSEIVARNGVEKIHLLHVDTEGWDFEVLKTLDFSRYAPLAIFIEHIHLTEESRTQMQKLLHENGYAVHACGRDYFAVKKRIETPPRTSALWSIEFAAN